MNYSETMSQLMGTIQKSIKNNDRLNYFKRELLKVLDKKEAHLSKSIDEYFKTLDKSLLNEFGIEKGRVGTVGEIRTWKDDKKYKKMPNGKWVRVYQKQDRSAEISIARLRGRIKNAQSVEELYEIVTKNIHRFEDENGQILPIVEELQKEVNNAKSRINSGKPSTKDQIEEYKQKQASKKHYIPKYIFENYYRDNESMIDYTRPENIKIGDHILNTWGSKFGRQIVEVKKIDITDKGDWKKYSFVDENNQAHEYTVGRFGASSVGKIREDYEFTETPLNRVADEFDKVTNDTDYQKRYDKLNEMTKTLKDYQKELDEKFDASNDGDEFVDFYKREKNNIEVVQREIDNKIKDTYWLLPEQKAKVDKFQNDIRISADKLKQKLAEIKEEPDFDKKHEQRLKVIKEIKSIMKFNDEQIIMIGNYNGFYPFKAYNMELKRLMDTLKEQNDKENNKRPSIMQASNDLLLGKKVYTPEEIQKATIAANKIKIEGQKLADRNRELIQKQNELTRKWSSLRFNDREAASKVHEEIQEVKKQKAEIFNKAREYSKELDTHMDVIIDDIINKEVVHDSSIDNAETATNVAEYMSNNGFFKEKNTVSLQGVDTKLSKRIFGMYEKFFTMVDLKGKFSGVYSDVLGKNTYAQVSSNRTTVEINKKFFNSEVGYDNSFADDISYGFHPDGPHEQIIIHELTHAMVNYAMTENYEDVAKIIKEKVLKTYKVKGMKNSDLIKKYVSGYGTKNADEFCAEAFARGTLGTDKNNICRAVVKEFVKTFNYLGGLFV